MQLHHCITCSLAVVLSSSLNQVFANTLRVAQRPLNDALRAERRRPRALATEAQPFPPQSEDPGAGRSLPSPKISPVNTEWLKTHLPPGSPSRSILNRIDPTWCGATWPALSPARASISSQATMEQTKRARPAQHILDSHLVSRNRLRGQKRKAVCSESHNKAPTARNALDRGNKFPVSAITQTTVNLIATAGGDEV